MRNSEKKINKKMLFFSKKSDLFIIGPIGFIIIVFYFFQV